MGKAMTWQSVQESNRRVEKMWFIPEPRRKYYRKNRRKCSCNWCQEGNEMPDRRHKERIADEIREFFSDAL